jgi:calcineurin-like phosphoesterase family protein
VKEEDIVFHLGDVAFGKAAWDLVSQLKGHKILVKGNHDWRVSNSKILNSGFEKIYTESVIINLFSVQHGLNWRVELSHTPLWEKRKEYNIYNLCGHVHDNWKQKSNILNVGIDVWWFKPISVFTLLEYFNSVLWHEADTFKGGL